MPAVLNQLLLSQSENFVTVRANLKSAGQPNSAQPKSCKGFETQPAGPLVMYVRTAGPDISGIPVENFTVGVSAF